MSLIDSKTKEKILPYFDNSTTMESIALEKYIEKYVFSKEYLDASKATEFLEFSYNDAKISNLKYSYFESAVDFNDSVKQWSGKTCESSSDGIPEEDGVTLLQAASSLCVSKSKLKYKPNKIIGSDILFFVSKIVDGNVKNDTLLVALDSKDKDAINLDDIGCVTGCHIGMLSNNFIGKINNKIRVRLHINMNGGDVSGYYYYDKMKKNIQVTGHRVNDGIILSAAVPDGKESFNGILIDGQFKGMWSNSQGNKKYPFTFYSMLIQ